MAVDNETMTPEQEAALFDAAISEGFNGTPTETPAEPEKPAETAEVTPPVEPPKEEPKTEPTPEYVQLTKDQYADLLKLKEAQGKLDQGFGTLGNIQQMLKALQDGAPISATSEDFAELAEDFPELRDALVKGQNRLLSRLKVPLPSNAPSVNPAEVVVQALRAQAEETLDEDHPDWREVTGAEGSNTAFRQWVATQPEAYQKKLWASNNGAFVSKQLTKFKEAQAKAPATPKPEPKNDRQERLRAAAAPRGVSPSSAPTSDESGFASAFASEAKTLGLAV